MLAAAEETSFRAVELDLPANGWEWAAFAGGLLLLVVLSVAIYVRDTASYSAFWRVWLTVLRLGVVAGLAVIALDPQERTQKMSFRPSRVALVVDTSLSMRFPESQPATGTPEPGDEAKNSRTAAIVDLLDGTPLVEQLREQHEVSIYTFDTKLAGPHHVFESTTPRTGEGPAAANPGSRDLQRVDWTELLQPQGVETRLGESLLDALREAGGRTLAGLVVITDGALNAGVEASSVNNAAKGANVRLVAIGVGGTEPPVNLQVASLQAPTDAHVGDPYQIASFIQAQGLAGRSVQVELLSKPEGDEAAQPELLETREVTLAEDGVPVEVTFDRNPTEAASLEYYVRAKPPEDVRELSGDDNERRKTVNVTDRKTRVLLVAGGPMRDYHFVRNMLHRHSAVEVDVWLQTVEPATAGQVSQESDQLLVAFPESPAELFEYDVIVAFDPDWSRISPEGRQRLTEWVSTHGGGLIFVAGDVYTGQLASAADEMKSIADMYPVFLSSYLADFQFSAASEQAWPVEFTDEGEQAGFLQLTDQPATSADAWKAFPGVYRAYPTAGTKAGAMVYGYFSDPRSQTEYGSPVLWASQFYGSGRTFYIGSAEMWRLRSASDEHYDRFWTKLIREIGQGRLRRGTTRGMLLVERNEYSLGQTVRIRASLLNPQLEPLDAENVPFEIYDPNDRPLTPARSLVRDKNRPGQFVGDFRASVPGTYRVVIPIPESNDQLVSKIDAVVPNLETTNPRQNVGLLTELVRDTGGKYLTLAAAAELPSLLPNQSEEFLVDERLRTLWDRQWVLIALVSLLAVEWMTRKLLKLA